MMIIGEVYAYEGIKFSRRKCHFPLVFSQGLSMSKRMNIFDYVQTDYLSAGDLLLSVLVVVLLTVFL